MQGVKFRFTAVCDWMGCGRACSCDAHVSGDPADETIEEFADRASQELISQGWRIDLDKPTLCWEHNTRGNRRIKKFAAPEAGSTADLVRRVRGES